MECGIKIKCKKRFGQFLITGKPYIIFNDNEKIELKWNEEFLLLCIQIVHIKSVSCFPI